MTHHRGILVSFEGIEGAGKSSVVRELATLFEKRNELIVLTREPGGTPLGKTLYALLQDHKVALSSRAEFLLFAADRAHHMETRIKPALAQGLVVISDRMADSSLTYQGYGRDLDKTMIENVNRWAMQDIQPDITFYMRISPESAAKRLKARNLEVSRFEQEKEPFWRRVIEGYEALAARESRFYILDAEKTITELAQTALNHIDHVRKQHYELTTNTTHCCD